jgi:adenylate kinase
MKYPAILLIGPTGSGKTPFGGYLNSKKLFQRNCYHFDFGAGLRSIEQLVDQKDQASLKNKFSLLGDKELAIIIHSLKSGSLLEDDQFYIAEEILLSFIAEKGITQNDLLVLNGLPRYTDQAVKIDRLVNITGIIYLNCTDNVVHSRIVRDSGGDRAGRNDDSMEEVRRKLTLFRERTLKLSSYDKEKGAKIYDIIISADTQPEDIYCKIATG